MVPLESRGKRTKKVATDFAVSVAVRVGFCYRYGVGIGMEPSHHSLIGVGIGLCHLSVAGVGVGLCHLSITGIGVGLYHLSVAMSI